MSSARENKYVRWAEVILWLERENEELRYHLGQAKNSSHALRRVYPEAKP